MRTYAQAPKTVWDIDYATAAAASLPAASSVHSGSFASIGYSRLTGVVYSDASMSGVCGIRVRQSSTSTPNWDYESNFALSACSGSAFSVEVIGRYVDIQLFSGATCAASILRSFWALRPI